jgi:hypothetical protein
VWMTAKQSFCGCKYIGVSEITLWKNAMQSIPNLTDVRTAFSKNVKIHGASADC